MKPRELFGVVVRVIGLVLILSGLKVTVPAFITIFQMGGGNAVPVLLGSGLPVLLLGLLFLLFGAELMVRLTYRRDEM